MTRKCPQIIPIFSCHFHEKKFVHVATKKKHIRITPSFPQRNRWISFLAGCLESEPGSILSFTSNSLPDIFGILFLAFRTLPRGFCLLDRYFRHQFTRANCDLLDGQEQLEKVSAQICKPLKEPRNRFPARWNRFLGSLNAYKVGLREASGRKEATV